MRNLALFILLLPSCSLVFSGEMSGDGGGSTTGGNDVDDTGNGLPTLNCDTDDGSDFLRKFDFSEGVDELEGECELDGGVCDPIMLIDSELEECGTALKLTTNMPAIESMHTDDLLVDNMRLDARIKLGEQEERRHGIVSKDASGTDEPGHWGLYQVQDMQGQFRLVTRIQNQPESVFFCSLPLDPEVWHVVQLRIGLEGVELLVDNEKEEASLDINFPGAIIGECNNPRDFVFPTLKENTQDISIGRDRELFGDTNKPYGATFEPANGLLIDYIYLSEIE